MTSYPITGVGNEIKDDCLCNNGVAGLRTKRVSLIVPRTHDCITLLLGSKERYREYFDAHPGTYFHFTGWIERNVPAEKDKGKDIPQRMEI